MTEHGIYTVDVPAEEKFLRQKTKPLEFSPKGDVLFGKESISKKELTDLVARMKKIMRQANGIGLSANQIGLSYRMFIAQVAGAQGESKFYAVFNPEIEKPSGEKDTMEEGCLSIPGVYGDVTRPLAVTLKGVDKQGKPLKIKAWGLLARVFQHEMDHLNGILFTDKAKNIGREPHSERLTARQ